MPEDGESVPCYIFFTRIATDKGSYMCDFFKDSQANGKCGYYVSVQSLCGHTDILVDLVKDIKDTWIVAYTSSELCTELQHKLINAVMEYEAGVKYTG